MFSALNLLIFLVSCSTVHAQIVVRRRRSSVGRIIAGCVVGVICLLVLLLLILRRRRRARSLRIFQQQAGQLEGNQRTGWLGGPGPFDRPFSAPPGPPPNHVHDGPSYPALPPPYVSDGNQFNNALPNAPPPAHTKEDQQFVGGFRP